MSSIAQLVIDRVDDANIAVRFGDASWTYAEFVRACATRAAFFASLDTDGPPHIGLLLENVAEFPMWLGAAAVAGATIVGINPTRRGAELERDITFTQCQIVITESRMAGLLDGLDLGPASLSGRLLNIDSPDYAAALAPFAAAPLPAAVPDPSTQFLLVFTSGTSGAPKAVIFSQARLHRMGTTLAGMVKLTADDVAYSVMPLFHSNGLVTSWLPTVSVGATLALRRKFSASNFLPDVRRFGATYFNYVGKPLAYVLATPEQPDDADNPLIRVYGNEGAEADITRFAARFNCRIDDGYGSTESSVAIQRTPDTPSGSLGRAADTVRILNADTGEECPRAVFDASGRLTNADQAIGEIVNTAGAELFEGYWNNEEATHERIRGGAYWSGDLGYRDGAGFFYFAGRSSEWLRVDGENIAAAPIERIISRYPGVLLNAVYGVPDADPGDRVMVALQLDTEGAAAGAAFDAAGFSAFLAAQSDLGPKWLPTYVRVVSAFPMTETNKVVKRVLQRERWESDDPVWYPPEPENPMYA
jgi:fatty-acyl-CoA synthase